MAMTGSQFLEEGLKDQSGIKQMLQHRAPVGAAHVE